MDTLIPETSLSLWCRTTLSIKIPSMAYAAAGKRASTLVTEKGTKEHDRECEATQEKAGCLAATQTPPLPLVEIQADRDTPVACSKVPAENMFVMLDRSDSFLYLYNKEGLLSLPEGEAETLRFRECQGYLDRD